MKFANKRISFSEFTYEEKKEVIYQNLIKVSSENFLNNLIETDMLEIRDCVRYKGSVGCPVVFFGNKTEEGKGKSKGRETFREINSRFPILHLMGIVKNLYSNEQLKESANNEV